MWRWRVILVGDANLINVADDSAPFALARDELVAADPSSPTSKAAYTGRSMGISLSMKAFMLIRRRLARHCDRPGSPRSGSPTTSITARRRSSPRTPASTGSASPQGLDRKLVWERGRIERVGFRLVRRHERDRTMLRPIAGEAAGFDAIARASTAFGTGLAIEGDEASVALRP
jgi:hypothetical protein